jgi:hypothetical protein
MATATARKPQTESLFEYSDNRGISLTPDAANGVIKGVKILGLESRNGRTYDREAVRGAIGLYEGARVNVNHPEGSATQPRDYRDRLGHLENVRQEADGSLRGDLKYNPKHPLAEQLNWDAANAPQNVGLSHNIQGKTRQRNGKATVESIERVLSVDLVADPATTSSLFESHNMPATIKISEVAKSLGKDHWLSKFLKEDGMGAMSDVAMPADTGGDAADADEKIKDAFRAMVMAAFDDESLDSKATLAKIRDILKAQERLTGGSSSSSTPAPSDGAPASEAMNKTIGNLTEQLDALKVWKTSRELDDTIKAELTEAKLPARAITDVFLSSLKEQSDVKIRKTMIEDRRRIVGTGPQSCDGTQALTEGDARKVTDGKSFAASIRR